MMKRCLPHSTPGGQDDRQSKNTKEEKTERQKDRVTKRQRDKKTGRQKKMVKQCKMLTSLNLRWTRWQRESSLCFQHHEAWRILLTRVWNIFSKAEDARREMFMSKSKCWLKPPCANVFYNVFQMDMNSRVNGIIFGILVFWCPPHIHPKETMTFVFWLNLHNFSRCFCWPHIV